MKDTINGLNKNVTNLMREITKLKSESEENAFL